MRPGSLSLAWNKATARASASAAAGSLLSDSTNRANAPPARVASNPSNRRRTGGRTTPMSSFRTVSAIAVRGHTPSIAATGGTAGRGSRSTNPITPLAAQNPTQGAAPRQLPSITAFATVQPPENRVRNISVPRLAHTSSTIELTIRTRTGMAAHTHIETTKRDQACEAVTNWLWRVCGSHCIVMPDVFRSTARHRRRIAATGGFWPEARARHRADRASSFALHVRPPHGRVHRPSSGAGLPRCHLPARQTPVLHSWDDPDAVRHQAPDRVAAAQAGADRGACRPGDRLTAPTHVPADPGRPDAA